MNKEMDSANNLAWESSGSIKKGGMNSVYIAPSYRGWIVVLVYNAKVTFSQIFTFKLYTQSTGYLFNNKNIINCSCYGY